MSKENMPLSFGKWLAKCRTEAGIKSQRQASLLLSTKYPHLNYYANGTIAKDETGITKNIPLERLESYSALYKLPLEKLIAEYLNARYGIDYSQKIEVKATRIEEVIPAEEREAYRLFRRLLEKKSMEGVLACLRMIIGEDEGKPTRLPVTPEKGHKNKGAA